MILGVGTAFWQRYSDNDFSTAVLPAVYHQAQIVPVGKLQPFIDVFYTDMRCFAGEKPLHFVGRDAAAVIAYPDKAYSIFL